MVWFSLKSRISKTSACVSFIKISLDFLNTCEKKRGCQFMRALTRNAKLIDGNCQKMHIRTICLDKEINFIRNKRLNFSRPSLHQRFSNSMASFINLFRNHFLRQKLWQTKQTKRKFFSILPENQTFCSPKLLNVFRPTGYQSTISY